MATLTGHQARALEYKKHISLTANAGSGKTFVLANRYLRIALEENVPLRSIAAITFTDKAAGELYGKIAKQIEESIAGSSDAATKRKLESIRSQLVSANISTIHSFCIDILREHPVEAGLDANFTAANEQTSGELIELSVEEVIKNSIKDESCSEDLKYLIRMFASKSLFAGEIASMIRNRKNVLGIAERIYSKPQEEISKFFRETFYELAEKIFAGRIPGLARSLKDVNDAVLSSNKDNEKALEVRGKIDDLFSSTFNEQLALIIKIQELIILEKGSLSLRGYAQKIKDDFAGDIELINSFFKDFGSIDFPNDADEVELELARFGKKMIFFFNSALEAYSKKKSESGYLDYEDILLYTKKILEL